MPASFTYSITARRLAGQANGIHFVITAVSGDGAGSKTNAWGPAANDPSQTCLKEIDGPSHVHGGPLPTGTYRIGRAHLKPKKGLWADLVPMNASHMCNRAGFAIHGRGPHGSDGCIVPLTKFTELMGALAADPGGWLVVVE